MPKDTRRPAATQRKKAAKSAESIASKGAQGASKSPAVGRKAAKVRRTPKASPAAKAPGEGQTQRPAFAALVQALNKEPQVSFGGQGFGAHALKVNGKMFAMIDRRTGAFIVKLPEARVEQLVADGTGTYFDSGRGRILKAWLSVTREPSTWRELAEEALGFVRERG